ncbi:MAG: uroporphyrinogen-III synthase [Gammaproteobacteria bacterium]
MPNQQPLRGVWILVTRPAHQADSVCQAIEAAGGNAIRWPVLSIEDRTQGEQAQSVVKGLGAFDLTVFVSENAAAFGVKLIRALGFDPSSKPVFAVGRGTAGALEVLGVLHARYPLDDPSSEELLSLPELQETSVSGRRILIFRGEGGRELLAETLIKRGAQVEYAEVYRRALAPSDPAIVSRHWEQGRLDLILVTSADGLRALVKMLSAREGKRLFATRLLVVGPRMVALARSLGFKELPLQIQEPSGDTVVEALLAWRKEQPG